MQTKTVEEGYRLSPQQRRLWSLAGDESSTPYRVQCAALVEGAAAAALSSALEDVAARHEILRTSFRQIAGMKFPVQVIGERSVEWGPGADLSFAPHVGRQVALAELFETMKRAPLNLNSGPLVRASLLRLSRSESILLLSAHALCADAAGAKNILRELAAALGPAGAASEEPLQYADISEYLSELLEEESAGAEYWGAYDLPELSSRRPHFVRAEAGEFDPRPVAVPLGEEAAARIEAAARASGSTVEAFMLACWQALLLRVTGWREVAVGVAFDGRRVEGLSRLPGAFVRYLPLEAGAGESFERLLAHTAARAAAHADWQDFFDWGTGAGRTYLPLCFDYEDLSVERAGGVSLTLLRLYSCAERFDLKLSCFNSARGVAAELHYDASRVGARDAECIAAEFATLAASAAADPRAPLARLDALGDDARRRILHDFNDTAADHSRAVPVERALDEHARVSPESLAVVSGDERLSYAELNARANRVARYLAARGVGPDMLVGVCVERSAEMLVIVLGVLKAGGAYLPLDPSYPRERLAFMVEDARPRLLVATRRTANRLKANAPGLIVLEDAREELSRQGAEGLPESAAPGNLAYVIYTSGSTGRPKGVTVTRGGLLNYLTWAARAYRVGEGAGAPVHSPLAFDLTVTSLFAPLVAGRAVLLLDDDEAAGELLAQSLRGRPDFSLVKLTPAHLELLALLLRPDEVEGAVRTLVVGGEALHSEGLAFWRAHAPATRIVNEYGPTETVVGCCVHEVEAGARGDVPIGRPIANTCLYVLDEQMGPSPFHAAGELYVGGAGVARGYLNRPALTAEHFIPDPFSEVPGARLYRTGDLARYRPDGTLEFLGRADRQVKVKGYRIELGEVEAALCNLAEVREAVVALREESGEKRMVAYVVARRGDEADAVGLQRRLQERLPEYMIPSAFVFLERLPLTPNGKVDRDALPAPDTSARDAGGGYAPPRTPAEKLLADLWSSALGVERVGIRDNFFELGGDSILSIQIANRANAAGVRFTPRQIFQNRTIEELAAVVGEASASAASGEAIVGPVPLTPIQQWFFEQELPEPHHWNQSLLLEVRGGFEPRVIEQALAHLAAHHDALRLRFHEEGGEWRQDCTAPGEGEGWPLARESFATVPEGEQGEAVASFASSFQRTLDLARGPVARAALIDLGVGRTPRLLLAVHHLCVDIVSWGVLLEGLRVACEQLARREQVRLPPKTTPFGVWAGRLAEYARSERMRGELEYWAADERRWACRVPVDYAGGENTEESSETVWASLDEERTRALVQDVPKVYRTMINDVLLTALAQSFSVWTSSRSLLVDLENHGREDIFDDVDLSRTVGWFTCIFPLLLDLGDARRTDEALKSVKEQIRRVPAGGVGYGLLRYMAGGEAAARLASLPQAEVCFNYVGRGGAGASEAGTFAPAAGGVGPTKSLLGRRRYLIEINGGITGGRLQTAWTYSSNLHARATVERFAGEFVRALEAIIAHCLSPEAGGFTPSDFSLPEMSQRELDSLIAEMGNYDE